MSCGKCGSSKCLCPFSLGVAVGVTSALAVFIWSVWVMYHGLPPMMQGMPEMTWSSAALHSLYGLIKGFIFGFLVALIYDLVAMRCKGMCCKKSPNDASCGCSCHSDNKPIMK